MNQDKAIERIQSLLKRTESNGASPAEADTAARMVCKLLIQFPHILKPDLPVSGRNNRRQTSQRTAQEREIVVVRYSRFLRQTENHVMIEVDNRVVWLPLSHVTFRSCSIHIPRWLADEHGLA